MKTPGEVSDQTWSTMPAGLERLRFLPYGALPLAALAPSGARVAVSASAFPRSMQKPQTGLAPLHGPRVASQGRAQFRAELMKAIQALSSQSGADL